MFTLPRTILLGVALLLATSRRISGEEPARDVQGIAIEQFDIHNDGDLIIIPVKIEDAVYRFVLDTGATFSCYDRTLKSHLGSSREIVTGTTVHGKAKMELFDAPKASLGKLDLPSQGPVACLDLRSVREGSGHQVYGIIGMDFLRKHVVSLDCDNGKLTFYNSTKLRNGVAVPLTFRDGVPSVEMEIKGLGKRFFELDTGHSGLCSGSLQAADFIKVLGRDAINVRENLTSIGVSQTKQVRSCIVEDIAIGPYHLNNRTFVENAATTSIGQGFLKQYNVLFDFPNSVMYLSSSQQFGTSEQVDRSGLRLLARDGCIIVDSVAKNSPASIAGIQPKDVILMFNGIDIGKFRMHAFRLLLCAEGLKVHLSMQRGEHTFESTLDLDRNNRAAQPRMRPGQYK